MSRSVFEVTGSLATDLATIDSNHIGVLVLWPSDGGREGYLRVISTREASFEHAAAIVNDDRLVRVHRLRHFQIDSAAWQASELLSGCTLSLV